MAELSLEDRFRRDPLGFLDEEFARSGGMVQTGQREYCVADPLAARSVLLNANKLYQEDSDFFATRHGVFGPRSAQIKIRNEARTLLRGYLETQEPHALCDSLRANLSLDSEWPDSGNRLIYRYLRPVLLASESPPKLLRLLDDLVERAVLKGSDRRSSVWRRMVMQFRVTLQVSAEIERRQATLAAALRASAAGSGPADLLDVVARAGEPGVDSADLVDVFLAFVFSVAGSVGFLLGWSIYLRGTHEARDVPCEWVVMEALRLWPVAWKLTRRPAKDHPLSGVTVGAAHAVSACPYLVQRHPGHWSESTEFKPERWANADSRRNPAFIPFGYGPHQCVAADLSIRLVTEILENLARDNEMSVRPHATRPIVGPALAPPPYRLTLQRRNETPSLA